MNLKPCKCKRRAEPHPLMATVHLVESEENVCHICLRDACRKASAEGRPLPLHQVIHEDHYLRRNKQGEITRRLTQEDVDAMRERDELHAIPLNWLD